MVVFVYWCFHVDCFYLLSACLWIIFWCFYNIWKVWSCFILKVYFVFHKFLFHRNLIYQGVPCFCLSGQLHKVILIDADKTSCGTNTFDRHRIHTRCISLQWMQNINFTNKFAFIPVWNKVVVHFYYVILLVELILLEGCLHRVWNYVLQILLFLDAVNGSFAYLKFSWDDNENSICFFSFFAYIKVSGAFDVVEVWHQSLCQICCWKFTENRNLFYKFDTFLDLPIMNLYLRLFPFFGCQDQEVTSCKTLCSWHAGFTIDKS